MAIVRYSAEAGGIPVDQALIASGRTSPLVQLMMDNHVRPTAIPEGTMTEVTPLDWEPSPLARIYVEALGEPPADGRPAPAEHVVVSFMSLSDLTTERLGLDETEITSTHPLTSVRIPTDRQHLPITGPSSIYPGRLCLHELLIDISDFRFGD